MGSSFRTELGRKLAAIRRRIVASGAELLTIDQITEPSMNITAPGVLTFNNQPGAEPLPPRPAAWAADAPSPYAAPLTAVEASTLRTTAQVAAALNRPARSILAVARRKGIRPAMVIGGTSMWDSSQLPELQPLPRGWPKGRRRGAAL